LLMALATRENRSRHCVAGFDLNRDIAGIGQS
jgi:hypothetical protein